MIMDYINISQTTIKDTLYVYCPLCKSPAFLWKATSPYQTNLKWVTVRQCNKCNELFIITNSKKGFVNRYLSLIVTSPEAYELLTGYKYNEETPSTYI